MSVCERVLSVSPLSPPALVASWGTCCTVHWTSQCPRPRAVGRPQYSNSPILTADRPWPTTRPAFAAGRPGTPVNTTQTHTSVGECTRVHTAAGAPTRTSPRPGPALCCLPPPSRLSSSPSAAPGGSESSQESRLPPATSGQGASPGPPGSRACTGREATGRHGVTWPGSQEPWPALADPSLARSRYSE